MSRQRVYHGMELNVATPDEVAAIIAAHSHKDPYRIRATSVGILDGNGNGTIPVYEVPVGYDFVARRIFFNIGGATDPYTGDVQLTAAGHYIQYQRSGTIICYAEPKYNGVTQVPGGETWGDEQGPYIRNGEVLTAVAVGLTPNVGLTVFVQGLLSERGGGEK